MGNKKCCKLKKYIYIYVKISLKTSRKHIDEKSYRQSLAVCSVLVIFMYPDTAFENLTSCM